MPDRTPLQPSAQKLSAKKILLRIALGLLVLVIVGAALLIGGVAYVRTESGSRRVLELAKNHLAADFGTTLSFDAGRLDPLTGLHFRHLHIERHQAPIDADITIENLDVDYQIGFFTRSLLVDRVWLDRPRIVVKITENAATVTEPAPTEAKKSGRSLSDLLRDPPATIEVKSVRIDDLFLDFTSVSNAGVPKLALQVHQLGFSSGLVMKAGQIQTNGQIKTGTALAFHLNGETLLPTGGRTSRRVGGQVTLDSSWDANVHWDGAEWIYEIKPSRLGARVSDLAILQNAAGSVLDISLPRLQAAGQFALLAHTKELFQPMPDAVRTDDVDFTLSTGVVKVATTSAGKTQTLNVAGETLTLKSKLEGPEISASAESNTNGVYIAGPLKKPIAVDLKVRAKIPRDFSTVTFDGGLTLDRSKLMELRGTAAMNDKGLEFKGVVDIAVEPSLADILSAAASLKPTLNKTGAIRAQIEVDAKKPAAGSAAGSGAGPIIADFKFTAPRVNLPGIRDAFNFGAGGHATYAAEQRRLDFDGDMSARHPGYGSWDLKTKLDMTSGLADGAKPAPVATNGRTVLTCLTMPNPKILPVMIGAPIELTHRISLGNAPAVSSGEKSGDMVDLHVSAPNAGMPAMVIMHDTVADLHIRSADLRAARDVDAEMTVSQGPMDLAPSAPKPPVPIKGMKVSLRAAVRDAVLITLDELKASVNDGMIDFFAQITGNTKTRDAQGHAEFDLTLKEPLDLGGQTIRGRVAVPAQISVFRGREIAVSGALGLSDIAWAKGAISIAGLTGRVPFSEKLVYDGKNVRFRELITQNPFERVDFERVRPLLQGTEQLKIAKIGWEDRTYGPFIGFFSLNQNMVSIHQFDLDLGAGRVYGEMFFDAYPTNLQFGLLSRLTGIDLQEVLPKKFLARMGTGEKNISGRSGFVLNLSRGLLDGRVDVTEIGGPALVAFINVLDPAYEDEKMNKVRTLLGLGYPTAVALAFKEGYMNMDVDLSLLGLSQRQSLREIPISSLLASATSDIVKKTAKGPLK